MICASLYCLRIDTIFRENEQTPHNVLLCTLKYEKNCDWQELIRVWQYMKDWLLCILVYCIQFLLIVEKKKATSCLGTLNFHKIMDI